VCPDVVQVPVAYEDIIPTNQYGNIEIWDGNERFVPRGCVLVRSNPNHNHLHYRSAVEFDDGESNFEDPHLASKVASRLNMYHAPAVFGFTYNSKNKKMIPTVGGVVVLARDAALLREAITSFVVETNILADAQSAENETKERKLKQERVIKRWEYLVKALFTKQRLRKLYGIEEESKR
jgi:hypothetical protein